MAAWVGLVGVGQCVVSGAQVGGVIRTDQGSVCGGVGQHGLQRGEDREAAVGTKIQPPDLEV